MEMENGAKNSCGSGCGCGMNGNMGSCGCGHNHMHVVKKLIKLAIIVIVFVLGVKFGELKGMLESQGYFGHGRYYGGNMMYGTDFNSAPQGGIGIENGTAPSAPAAPQQ